MDEEVAESRQCHYCGRDTSNADDLPMCAVCDAVLGEDASSESSRTLTDAGEWK